jgi:outer membrane protein W
MKKIIVTIMMLGLFASAAHAANGLGVFGAYWDTDDMDDAFGGGARLKLEIVPNIAIEVRGTYFPEFSREDNAFKYTVAAIPVEGALTVSFPMNDQFSLYVGGGGGYYMFNDGELKVKLTGDKVDADPDDEFGFFALGGAEFAISGNVSLFAEAKYTWLKFDKIEVSGHSMDLGEDVKLDGFGANAGLMLTW